MTMLWWMQKMNSWTYQSPQDDKGGQNGGSGDDTGKNDGERASEVDGGKGDPDDDKGEKGENKGTRKPTNEEAKLLKEVMQKKEALQKTQADLAAAQERLKQFEGIDPEAVKKLLAEQAAAETARLEAKGEYERVKQRMAEEHEKQIKSKDELIAQLQEQLAAKEGTINELSIGQQFAQSQFIAEELTLTPAKARVVYGAHFDVVDGKVVAYDKPRGAANRTALVDQYGNNVSFDEALRKIVEADPDKDHLIKSKVKPGAGSNSTAKSATGKLNTEGMGSIDKINAGLKSLRLNASANAL